MNNSEDEVLNELRRQSGLLEAIARNQAETTAHLKVIGTLVAVSASVFAILAMYFLFF